MPTRLEFCAQMAALASGLSAGSQQIEAFTHLYDVNTELFGDVSDLIQVNDLSIGFEGVPCDITMCVKLYTRDEGVPGGMERWTLNYRGHVRWAAIPSAPMFSRVSLLRWEVSASAPTSGLERHFAGSLCYTDMDCFLHRVQIGGEKGRLIDVVPPSSLKIDRIEGRKIVL